MTDDSAPWIVFDIDGTVADCRHRQIHLDERAPDWETFFAASGADTPLTEGVTLAIEHAARGHLLWLTGRPERYRALTVRWLRAQGLPTTHLYMRLDEDLRPAAVFKAERLRLLAVNRRIALVVDDDESVVASLRRDGWPVMHAGWMS